MKIPWFWPGASDPVKKQARDIVAHLDARLGSALPGLATEIPILARVPANRWCEYGTVAGVQLAIFPLLRFVDGDGARYQRLIRVMRTALDRRFPSAPVLWVEAGRATIPPSGTERTRTLHEVDEAQALALARWLLAAVSGTTAVTDRWDTVKTVGGALRASVEGYWQSGPAD